MQSFPFAFDERYSWMLRLLGVSAKNAMVTLEEEKLRVRFGRWGTATPVTNIAGCEVSGPYRWYRAIGLRYSLADHGISFGTSVDRGLCVRFVEPIGAFLPAYRPHPGMTVTVADVDGLAAALAARGVAGCGGAS